MGPGCGGQRHFKRSTRQNDKSCLQRRVAHASDFEPRLAHVPHHVKFSYKVLEAQQIVMYADIPSQSRYMRVKSTTDCAFFAPRLLLCLLSSSLGHLAFLGWQGVNSVFVCL